jgi:hypothetical protein
MAPIIEYSTYFGGESTDTINDVAVDGVGNIYVVGQTYSRKLELQNPAQGLSETGNLDSGDAFVAKFTPDGAHLVYSTYLGGNRADNGLAVAVDDAGFAYVTGTTKSQTFPTKLPLQKRKGGSFDAFVTKLSPGGEIVYSTYLGGTGSDQGRAIRVDSEGNAFVVGATGSPNFPVTADPIGASVADTVSLNVFVTKINASGTAIVYSRTIGGSDTDYALAVAVDEAGAVSLTGVTTSADFPTLRAVQSEYGGEGADPTRSGDAFVAGLDPSGELTYSTYIGGSSRDVGYGIAVAADGAVYVAGQTLSTDFPTRGAAQTDPDPNATDGYDAFVTALEPSGASLRYSTYYGGSGIDGASDVAVDSRDVAYVSGTTSSSDVARGRHVGNELRGESDAFVAAFDPAGAVLASTFLGGGGRDGGAGIAVSADGAVYVAGTTASPDFPTVNPFQTRRRKAGTEDGFVAKLDVGIE